MDFFTCLAENGSEMLSGVMGTAGQFASAEMPGVFTAFLKAAISIFAIVNPIGNLPVFAGLTDQNTTQERRSIFHLAAVIALVIIVFMATVGQLLLEYVFRISINEFRFAGGLLLMLVGFRNILTDGRRRSHLSSSDSERRHEEQINTAISPIAIPMLSGPGSIVTVMLLAGQYGRIFTALACLASFIAVIGILHWSELFYRLMGKIGARAVGRVMQIFIVAIGVKFCFDSLAIFVGSLR